MKKLLKILCALVGLEFLHSFIRSYKVLKDRLEFEKMLFAARREQGVQTENSNNYYDSSNMG